MGKAPAAKTAASAAKGIGGFLAIILLHPPSQLSFLGGLMCGLIASLVLGVISTVLIVWMGNIEEEA